MTGSPQESAQEITKRSKSNLAFALQCLPKERRNDLVVFYAFCRVIDDIADDTETTPEVKAEGLSYWKEGLINGFANPAGLEAEVIEVRERYGIPTSLFTDLITGCEMDLAPRVYQTWEELQEYTYRVACVVGLISLYIFGADPERSRQYALKLGHALQLTNIMRDVGEDLDNEGRIYLPIEDLERFDYTEQDLSNKVYDDRFRSMMRFQEERARKLYQEAESALHAEDQAALKSARIMGDIYSKVLDKIEKSNYAVLDQRISISKPHKVYLLLKGMVCY